MVPDVAVGRERISSEASGFGIVLRGGVSERPKERASKAREGQPSAGSNPAATATSSPVFDLGEDGVASYREPCYDGVSTGEGERR